MLRPQLGGLLEQPRLADPASPETTTKPGVTRSHAVENVLEDREFLLPAEKDLTCSGHG